MQTITLEELPTEDLYKFGGPDVVRIQEKKLLEKRKKERQLKRTQIEKKRFLAQTQQQNVEERPLSRDDRKIKMAIMMFKQMEESDVKKHQIDDGSAPSKVKPKREGEENPSSNHHRLKETGRTTDGATSLAPAKRLSIHGKKKETMAPFAPAMVDTDEQDLGNTHFNQKHKMEGEQNLIRYIRQYELSVGSNRHELLNTLTDRLIDRQTQEMEQSHKDTGGPEGDKFSDSILSLCEKLNGIDLNQPLKTILQQLK